MFSIRRKCIDMDILAEYKFDWLILFKYIWFYSYRLNRKPQFS